MVIYFMKTLITLFIAAFISSGVILAEPSEKTSGTAEEKSGYGPMSADFRGVIHSLFAEHEKVDRSVELTETGYRASTTSKDSKVAATLQKHVAQMESRLEGGFGVRHWDPAFVELREHYDELGIEVKNIEGGVSVTVVGNTPEAIKVAQHHAGIISGFVEKGGEQMHATHPAAVTKKDGDPKVTTAEKGKAGGACGDGQCDLGKKPCCAARAEIEASVKDTETKTPEK